jgi:sec-independent protein translocase protein TatA
VFDISPVQILIVLAVALLIFGPRRLPGMGRDLGRGIRDFKDGLTGRPGSAEERAPERDRPSV